MVPLPDELTLKTDHAGPPGEARSLNTRSIRLRNADKP